MHRDRRSTTNSRSFASSFIHNIFLSAARALSVKKKKKIRRRGRSLFLSLSKGAHTNWTLEERSAPLLLLACVFALCACLDSACHLPLADQSRSKVFFLQRFLSLFSRKLSLSLLCRSFSRRAEECKCSRGCFHFFFWR